MTTPAIVHGEFVDAKLIRTRSALQIVVEVPIERANATMAALGGWPIPGESRPVAVARLQEPAESEAQSDEAIEALQDDKPAQRKSTHRGPMTNAQVAADPHRWSRQAAMACADRRFQKFLFERHRPHMAPELCNQGDWAEASRKAVHGICGVKSRKEFDTDSFARERWERLHAEYLAE